MSAILLLARAHIVPTCILIKQVKLQSVPCARAHKYACTCETFIIIFFFQHDDIYRWTILCVCTTVAECIRCTNAIHVLRFLKKSKSDFADVAIAKDDYLGIGSLYLSIRRGWSRDSFHVENFQFSIFALKNLPDRCPNRGLPMSVWCSVLQQKIIC